MQSLAATAFVAKEKAAAPFAVKEKAVARWSSPGKKLCEPALCSARYS
jgi:hypothetical protein